jgi:tRNA (adenine57-N1/adenine58-N1)-methyltransferase
VDADPALEKDSTASDRIRPDDRVIVADGEGNRLLLVAGEEPQRVAHFGVLDPSRFVGLAWGSSYAVGSRAFRLVRPGFEDFAGTLVRKAQIVLPKDAARILFECDIRAGRRVVEAGAGSGALTLALALAVVPGGHVTVYDIRNDFADHARRNIERAGVAAAVTLKIGDVASAVTEREVDAFILDVPSPADAVPAAREALRADGFFAAYTPLVAQAEAVVGRLRSEAFANIRTLELVERPWHIGERGSRPEHEFLGHTAFLTFARRG